MSVIESLLWDAQYKKTDVCRISHVSRPTLDKMMREGLRSSLRVQAEAVIRVLSERLLALGKIASPLDYETLLEQEEEERNNPDRRQVAC